MMMLSEMGKTEWGGMEDHVVGLPRAWVETSCLIHCSLRPPLILETMKNMGMADGYFTHWASFVESISIREVCVETLCINHQHPSVAYGRKLAKLGEA